ncbi:hypothetical protein EIN_470050 [Entamoeba invadens IP1]|uniref:Uncharacterized protein n=1 Tax=Entamoeba invadens IP1 TaxID=370355 RepID=A0A0A1TZ14_ENTIV|nr:hypothetical protein EIN_470050 [Entamoeba invadens IP1]ELP83771.1 hypothetical protein EIN_470050 [Entamoeba invadens IP1]|eukprot:XP_004183117.1 hypothetical protein EIN_470050 [Entamoeba invadens IP1]
MKLVWYDFITSADTRSFFHFSSNKDVLQQFRNLKYIFSKNTTNHVFMPVTRQPRFIEVRNNQVYEQMVLLWIINKRFSISLKCPNKKATVFEQFLTVEYIWDTFDEIEVKKVVYERCSLRYQQDLNCGISQKTAKRRKNNNYTIECLQLLVDIVRELGFFVETEQCGGKKVNFKEEYIKYIYYDGVLLFNSNSIQIFGKTIIDTLNCKYTNLRSIVLEKDVFSNI